MEKQILTKNNFIDNANLIISLASDEKNLMKNAKSIVELASLIKFFGQALPDGQLAIINSNRSNSKLQSIELLH